MKKYFVMALMMLISVSCVADQPILIGLPSPAWMKKFKYGNNEQMPNGRTRFNPDYHLALEDTEMQLTAVLRAASKPFEEFFKVEDLQGTLENVDNDMDLFDELGVDNPADQVAYAAKADIKLNIQYVEDVASRMGPRKRYNVEVSAVDAYTNDIIATFSDVTALDAAPVNIQVGKCVSNHMQALLGDVNKHCQETIEFGREVRVSCVVKGMSFNQDQAEGQVLKYYVRDVLKSIAYEGRSTNKRDDDRMQDYRIRLRLDQKVEELGELLQNKFASAGIPVSVKKVGLGQFAIVFGE